jgi:putative membrane protein
VYHDRVNLRFIAASFIIGLAGFLVEVLGIHTGFPFGSYQYLTTLGPKLWGVPLVLAINWVLLIYCTSDLASRFSESKFISVLLAAVFMVGLDFLIEPVAIKYDYWVWSAVEIPIQNYLAWFVISLGFHWFFRIQVKSEGNPIAPFTIIAQVIYFSLLNLL